MAWDFKWQTYNLLHKKPYFREDRNESQKNIYSVLSDSSVIL